MAGDYFMLPGGRNVGVAGVVGVRSELCPTRCGRGAAGVSRAGRGVRGPPCPRGGVNKQSGVTLGRAARRRPPPLHEERDIFLPMLSTKLYNMPLHMSSYSLRPHWLYEISDK